MAVSFAATLLAVLAVGARAPATAPDTLTLPGAIELARTANPRLRAERLKARATAERIVQAGAWPNPELGFGLQNRPLSNFGTEEMMTMNTVRLSQMVPWPGKQSLGRDGARGLAAADSLDALDMDAMLVAQVKAGYYRIAATDRSLEVMRETLNLLRSFRETSLSRYTVGETIQQDVLQAEVGVARMEADIAAMEQERLAEAARFNALLARDPGNPVGVLLLPPVGGELPAVDSLARLAAARPAVAAAEARVTAAAASVHSARKELWPDLMFSVEYGQRPRYDDMLSLMVGFSVPVFSGSRQQPMRREMEAMQAMREADARDLLNGTWARLAEMRAMADRARRLDGLYGARILPQAKASVESALSAYLVGGVDFMTLVDSRMTVNQYAIERIRLAADYHIAVAEIVALLGGREVTP
jgi:cobalt-zinc-cadmium efflux system outer membrane protein